MECWRINTDSKAREDIQTCDLWYKSGMAFAGDYAKNKLKHANVFKKLSIGDGIFMHHSGLGIVGYGLVQETWDGLIYKGSKKLFYTEGEAEELYEYRIAVAWDRKYDCRKNPLEINHRLPCGGTYSHIDTQRWDVESVLRDLINHNLVSRYPVRNTLGSSH